MSQENVEIVRRLLAAAERGDVEGMLENMTDDVVVDASRRVLDPIVLEGHDGFKKFMAFLREAWANQRLEPEEFIEAGNQVVIPVRVVSTGRTSGVTIDARAAWVNTFRGDKIARLTVYQSRAEALEAVGLSEQDATGEMTV
jgi:ketosteroid isomerase-like protein